MTPIVALDGNAEESPKNTIFPRLYTGSIISANERHIFRRPKRDFEFPKPTIRYLILVFPLKNSIENTQLCIEKIVNNWQRWGIFPMRLSLAESAATVPPGISRF
ncbi:hypothetical protein [Rhizobium laguerreae]|uniref:hypothetical protein n=1 Tax=Rhizobium laguerreae TaxID=1076926 RepID=UPI001C8FEEB4|nr:hypothetical protein [Rhizobium laguerreae]MBY3049298.1 hypothetical protein [Rhizobium laguerreae]